MDGYYACMYKTLIRKPDRKRPFGRPRCKWEDNMKMDLKKTGCLMWTSDSGDPGYGAVESVVNMEFHEM
jgi:hypothetical protein